VRRDALEEAILYLASPDNCRDYWVAHRWPKGVICPYCDNTSVTYMEKYNRWQCSRSHALRQFTAKTGTIFEDSPLGLDKWLMAMWLVVNCQNGVSPYELHVFIGVAASTASVMHHRLRLALGMSSDQDLPVYIGAEEELVNCEARNMESNQGEGRITGGRIKRKPAPHVPGNSPKERLSNALSMVLTLSKADLLRGEAKAGVVRARARTRRGKKSA
jgi:hypothetical protein